MSNLAFLKLFGGGEDSTSSEVPLLQAILFRNGELKPGEESLTLYQLCHLSLLSHETAEKSCPTIAMISA